MVDRSAFVPAFQRHLAEARRTPANAYTGLLWRDHDGFVAAQDLAWKERDWPPLIAMGLELHSLGRLSPKKARRLWWALVDEQRFAEALMVLEDDAYARPDTADYWRGLAAARAGVGRIGDAIAAIDRARELEPSEALDRQWDELSELKELQGRIWRLADWAEYRRLAELHGDYGLNDRVMQTLNVFLSRDLELAKEDIGVFLDIACRALSMSGPEPVHDLVRGARRLFSLPDDCADIDRVADFLLGDADWTAAREPEPARRAVKALRLFLAMACAAAGRRDAASDRLGQFALEYPNDEASRHVVARCVSEQVLDQVKLAYIARPRRKIFDLFPFNNELAILDMHLHEMAEWVDHFVIVEANVTFTDRPKPLYFADNRSLFEPFLSKIVHVVVDRFPDHITSAWPREFYQRDMALGALSGLVAEDDLILISDADEIADEHAIRDFHGEFALLRGERCKYFLNYRERLKRDQQVGLQSVWKARYLKRMGLSYARFALPYLPGRPKIFDASWHFTSIFDPRGLAEKAQNTSHEQYKAMDEHTFVQAFEDIRQGRLEPGWERCDVDERFPAYIRQHQHGKLAHLLL